MNNHQNTIFHQFKKCTKLIKSVILLIIPIYAKTSNRKYRSLRF
ncbi:hypothetical protein MNB_SUP05-SYMBIONT-5-403 [hydrothermal vent metagenome]|uniref:TolB protein, periplasmic protein involved in the tonb-independent uptake of group A colicins n=1 Tax=hydrothermal vent metagenome TaxID=652676 RepID=A0A1W1E259_9ZZZZ